MNFLIASFVSISFYSSLVQNLISVCQPRGGRGRGSVCVWGGGGGGVTYIISNSENDYRVSGPLQTSKSFLLSFSLFCQKNTKDESTYNIRSYYRTCSYKRTVKQFSNLKDYNQSTFIYFFIKNMLLVLI